MSKILGVNVWRWWDQFEGTTVERDVVESLTRQMTQGWVTGEYCRGAVQSRLLSEISEREGNPGEEEERLLRERLAPIVCALMFRECGM